MAGKEKKGGSGSGPKRTPEERERDFEVISSLYLVGKSLRSIAQELTKQYADPSKKDERTKLLEDEIRLKTKGRLTEDEIVKQAKARYKSTFGLKLTHVTISNDLEKIHQRWLDSSLVDFDKAKALELAKLNHLESVYLDAWERSKQDHMKTVTESFTGEGPEEEIEVNDNGRKSKKKQRPTVKVTSKAQITKEGQVGDPRFLAGVKDCIEMRMKVFGMFKPSKIALTDPEGEEEYGDGQGYTDAQRLASCLAVAFGGATSAHTPHSDRESGVDADVASPGDGVSERGG